MNGLEYYSITPGVVWVISILIVFLVIVFIFLFVNKNEDKADYKIAVLSDIHGNMTALEAVLADAKKEKVTHYWILGDLLMFGPGSEDLIQQLKSLPNAIIVKGEWDEDLIIAPELSFCKPVNVYIAMLSKYHRKHLSKTNFNFIRDLPSSKIVKSAGLDFLLCHHLPRKRFGNDLHPTGKQESFNLLLKEHQPDVAVYGHMHRQVMRYSSDGRLIINPGSIHVPVPTSDWEVACMNLNAQYAIIEARKKVIKNVKFKRVDYKIEKEIALAKERKLPYLELYEEALKTGHCYLNDNNKLKKINNKHGYQNEVISFFR